MPAHLRPIAIRYCAACRSKSGRTVPATTTLYSSQNVEYADYCDNCGPLAQASLTMQEARTERGKDTGE